VRTWQFESRWPLPGPPDRVYEVLGDVECYPQWWPQVRAAGWLGDGHGVLLIRSALPLTLELELTASVQDPAAGILESRIDGDLIGWSRFTVGADVHYEQEVSTPRWYMNLAPRGVLRANHERMMRSAERGLAARVRASVGP
jgi:hypothetical protein